MLRIHYKFQFMKKILLTFYGGMLIFFLSTCKKDPLDIPMGTIKAKINGNEKTFNIMPKATRLNVTGGHGLQVQGYYRDGSTTNLTFSIVSPNPITSGTYTENTVSNPLVSMTHCIEVISPCVIQTTSYISTSNPVSITITEITSSSVKGTFKGDLKNSTSSGSPSSDLFTNGVFYVSF